MIEIMEIIDGDEALVKEFLVVYKIGGNHWSFNLFANDLLDAKQRVEAIQNSTVTIIEGL